MGSRLSVSKVGGTILCTLLKFPPEKCKHLMKSMILLHAWLARLDVSRRAPDALCVRTSLRARVRSSRARSSRLQLAVL